MEALISIIIPVYNHARVLRRCLSSIKRQTYRPLEVIIVNDGSTDNFAEVMSNIRRDYSKNGAAVPDADWRIKIIEQKNLGAAAARNAGFAESLGNYVIFWDADTVARPNMLQKMKQALDTHPMSSYAYSRFCFGWKKMQSHEFDANLLKKINYIDTTALIRRADFSLFDESLKRFQDWDLWLGLLKKNKTGIFVPEILFKKITRGRKGISDWLPSFVYKLPWKTKKVREYEEARSIVFKKYGL